MIKRISVYAASSAAVVVGVLLFVNSLGRDELGASLSDLAMAEKEFVQEEVDVVTIVPDIEEIVADNYQPENNIRILSSGVPQDLGEMGDTDVEKEPSLMSGESDMEVAEVSVVAESTQVQVIESEAESSEFDVAEELVAVEELYGYEEYLLEEDYGRKGGSFSLSAGGNMSVFPGTFFQCRWWSGCCGKS